jgi:hypothetical protein
MAHRQMRTLIGTVAVVACLGGLATAQAVDQPIDAQRLLLRVSGNGHERLVLVSHDRSIALAAPEAGSASSLELFSHSTGEHVVLPFGPPEAESWKERRGGRRGPVVVFRVPRARKGERRATTAGVVRLVHRVNRHLELVANAVGLAPDVTHTGVGVRLTVGTTRLCALFDARTVRRSRPGFFSGIGASAAGLADCSDASLAGPAATTSTTVSTTSTSTSTTSTTMAGLLIGNPDEFPLPSDHTAGFLVGTRVTVPMAATVTDFGVIGKMAGPHVRLGLYRDQGGEPTTLVVGTPETALAAGRVEVSVPGTPVAAGDYWLMALYDSEASVGLDQSDPTVPVRFTDAFFADGLPPSLFFTETFFGQRYNYYVRIVP